MPDLLIELRSEEIPARPLARSGEAASTGKPDNGMRVSLIVEAN